MNHGFDFLGDICEDCRHRLELDGSCPACGWLRPRDEGPLLPYRPDGLPSIGC